MIPKIFSYEIRAVRTADNLIVPGNSFCKQSDLFCDVVHEFCPSLPSRMLSSRILPTLPRDFYFYYFLSSAS